MPLAESLTCKVAYSQSGQLPCNIIIIIIIIIKLKESRNRPGMAQRVPGDLGSQIFMTFGT